MLRADDDWASVGRCMALRPHATTRLQLANLATLVKEFGVGLAHLAVRDRVVKGGPCGEIARKHAVLQTCSIVILAVR